MEPRQLKRPESSNTVSSLKLGKNVLLSNTCLDMLNFRIQQEELSSRIYLAMSMYLNNQGYMNAAALWKKYSEEELVHADFARDYLLAMGVQPNTPVLESPQQTFAGLPDIIKLSYQHEIDVTNQCKELAACALKEGDFQLFTLAQKYLTEQIEEQDKTQTLLDQLNSFGEDKIALRLFDQELRNYL